MDFAVQANRLLKVYDGKAGKAFAHLGLNGSGKTTVMCILTTQIKPTGGEAHVFGLDVV